MRTASGVQTRPKTAMVFVKKRKRGSGGMNIAHDGRSGKIEEET